PHFEGFLTSENMETTQCRGASRPMSKTFEGKISPTGKRYVLITSNVEEMSELPITGRFSPTVTWGEGGVGSIELSYSLMRYVWDQEGRKDEDIPQGEFLCLYEFIDYFKDNEEWRMDYDGFKKFYGAMKEYLDAVREQDGTMAQ